MKIHFFGYSLDIMGSLQKYNAGLTAFDAKKEFQNISCGRLIFWSYQPHETIRAAAGGSSTLLSHLYALCKDKNA